MYEAYYGFTARPFQLNPDPAFYFASTGHKRAMAYLEYGLHQNEGFIVITGEVGAGKTTLVRSLLEKLDTGKVVAAQLVTTLLEAGDILPLLAAAFGVPAQADKAQTLLALEAFLVSVNVAGKRALLIVDEAQNLNPRAVEELRMLSNFQLGQQALLQSFLIGQPEFRATLQRAEMSQLRQRVIASFHLGPLDAAETRGYIEHRLHCVGWAGVPAFDDDAHEKIFHATRGTPRRINTLCERLLLSGLLNETRRFAAADVERVHAEMEDEAPAPASAHPPMDALAAAQLLSGDQESRLVRIEQRMADILRLIGMQAGLHTQEAR